MTVIDTEISEVEAAIKPLSERLESLRRRKREEASRSFIAANNITASDVEMSSGDGKPWFGTVWKFGKWLKDQPKQKPWAEWNGRIYHSVDLMNGRMPDMPGLAEDLK